MPRRKNSESEIRKLLRLGGEKGSLAVTIPVDIARELGLRERQKMVVKRSGKRIIIQDWSK